MIIEYGVKIRGKCSEFGGPLDSGVAPDENLAIITSVDQLPQVFLDHQPEGTTGLARRLDPESFYCACRWDYSVTPKSELRKSVVRIQSLKNNRHVYAFVVDFGPHERTGRTIDFSPGVMKYLEAKTDDEVEHTLIKIQDIQA